MKKNGKKKGFTLIELIVVIAILGILAAIAVPRLTGFIGTSKSSADVSTGKTIQTAAMTAYSSGELILDGSATAWTISIPTDSSVTPTNVTAKTGSTVLGVMQKYLGTTLPIPQTAGKTFLITFDVNGGATVGLQ